MEAPRINTVSPATVAAVGSREGPSPRVRSALAQISKWARTVKRSGERIGKKADSLKRKLTKNLAVMEKHFVPCNGELFEP